MNSRGFTLVEILVVIVVLAALAIFSTVALPIQLAKARDAVRKSNIDRIKNAIEEYYADKGCYPISIPTCNNSLVFGDKTYLSNLPCDPNTKNSYVYVSEINSCPSWFQVYGSLEYTNDDIIDKLGCRNGCGPKCQFNYGATSSNETLNRFCQETAPIPSAAPTPSPNQANLQYVCAPGGSCEIFANPSLSGCPDIYLDDPTCQNQCGISKNRCHDARGKTN